MNTNKLLVGTLIGGVAYFLFGWLLYGMLFAGALASAAPGMDAVQKENPDMVAMIIGCLVSALLLAYIFEKWAGIRSLKGGLIAGGTIGFLIALGYDSILHGTSTLLTWGGVFLDSFIYAIESSLVGGLIGWWLGYNRK